MHRCLQIHEILAQTFQYVREDEPNESGLLRWPPVGASTLAALAISCKTLSGPALDALWYHQHSLGPLIRCMPSDAYNIVASGPNPLKVLPSIVLCRDLISTDYDKLYEYSRRIRILGSSYEGTVWRSPSKTYRLHPSVLKLILRSKNERGLLLPNVKHLRIGLHEFRDDGATPYAQLVVGPNLRTVSLCFVDYDDDPLPTEEAWENVEAILAPSSPSLSVFTISLLQPYPVPVDMGRPDGLLRLYKTFSQLGKLDAMSVQVTHDTLFHLATLSNLKTLVCSIEPDELELYHNMNTRSTGDFPKLEDLIIGTSDCLRVVSILQGPGFQSVSSLTIIRRSLGTKSMWNLDKFFEGFRSQTTVPKLTSLYLKTEDTILYPDGNLQSVSLVTKTTLAPIFLRDISNLVIDFGGIFDIDDGTLADLAEAWPGLEVLVFSDWSTEMLPGITLQGLTHLASRCKKLKKLTLRVNALNTDTDKIDQIIPATGLTYFNVCKSPATDHQGVVAFLDRVFPNISKLKFGWHYGEPGNNLNEQWPQADFYACWSSVLRTLKL